VHPNESADHELDMADVVPGPVQRVTGSHVPPAGSLGKPRQCLVREGAQVRGGERIHFGVVDRRPRSRHRHSRTVRPLETIQTLIRRKALGNRHHVVVTANALKGVQGHCEPGFEAVADVLAGAPAQSRH
jgi:hypothetical protein